VILLKGTKSSFLTRYDFKALYERVVEGSGDETGVIKQILVKVFGKTTPLSPMVIEEEMVEKYLRYN
jgi:hypothetical protein